jgi:hypothetical protein
MDRGPQVELRPTSLRLDAVQSILTRRVLGSASVIIRATLVASACVHVVSYLCPRLAVALL